VHLVLENESNAAGILDRSARPHYRAQWNDDVHHVLHVLLTGERDGYYADYHPALPLLGRCLTEGFAYQGDWSAYRGHARGDSSRHLPPTAFVSFLQNHDQVGNRAFGERITELAPAAGVRAATAVLLLAPAPPLLFMGQEWAASSPFLFFTDHNRELGRLVTEGRRREFSRFQAFADAATRARIPDPQAASTFDASRLDWEECVRAPHAGMLELYRALLRLRRTEKALAAGTRCDVAALDDDGIALARAGTSGGALLLVAWLRGSGAYRYDHHGPVIPGERWTLVLSTEEQRFHSSGQSPTPGAELAADGPLVVTFEGPAAVILRRE
jgi:malto-oligosyltrehalose trehalohydrolase